MGKQIDWSQTYKQPMGKRTTYREKVQKSISQLEETQKAEQLLRKAMPLMKGLLLTRMTDKTEITVMRPFYFTSEELVHKKQYEGSPFEQIVGSEFRTVQKSLPIGTKLVFERLDKSMNQLIFRTEAGNELGIYLEEQDRLLTQTDIYEVVSKYLSEGETTNE